MVKYDIYEERIQSLKSELLTEDSWGGRLSLFDKMKKVSHKALKDKDIHLNSFCSNAVLRILATVENTELALDFHIDDHYPVRDVFDFVFNSFERLSDPDMSLDAKSQLANAIMKEVLVKLEHAQLMIISYLDERYKELEIDCLHIKDICPGYHDTAILISDGLFTHNPEVMVDIIKNSVHADSLDVSIGNMNDNEYHYLCDYITLITALSSVDYWLVKCFKSAMFDNIYIRDKLFFANQLDRHLMPQSLAAICSHVRKVRNNMPEKARPRYEEDDTPPADFLEQIRQLIK